MDAHREQWKLHYGNEVSALCTAYSAIWESVRHNRRQFFFPSPIKNLDTIVFCLDLPDEFSLIIGLMVVFLTFPSSTIKVVQKILHLRQLHFFLYFHLVTYAECH